MHCVLASVLYDIIAHFVHTHTVTRRVKSQTNYKQFKVRAIGRPNRKQKQSINHTLPGDVYVLQNTVVENLFSGKWKWVSPSGWYLKIANFYIRKLPSTKITFDPTHTEHALHQIYYRSWLLSSFNLVGSPEISRMHRNRQTELMRKGLIIIMIKWTFSTRKKITHFIIANCSWSCETHRDNKSLLHDGINSFVLVFAKHFF